MKVGSVALSVVEGWEVKDIVMSTVERGRVKGET